ncbi:hypothetical protein DFH09DRAFT_222164 [Mycena vulgaris]|nr:hypothetical protein DFH09DRAFT_222164 [Mycena vulgaris]
MWRYAAWFLGAAALVLPTASSVYLAYEPRGVPIGISIGIPLLITFLAAVATAVEDHFPHVTEPGAIVGAVCVAHARIYLYIYGCSLSTIAWPVSYYTTVGIVCAVWKVVLEGLVRRPARVVVPADMNPEFISEAISRQFGKENGTTSEGPLGECLRAIPFVGIQTHTVGQRPDGHRKGGNS